MKYTVMNLVKRAMYDLKSKKYAKKSLATT